MTTAASATKYWLMRFGATACVWAVLTAGGCNVDPQCEPPLSDQRTPVADAYLPGAWTRPDATSFRVVVTTGPYRVSDLALANLRDVMSEQAGLRVEVVEGMDTGLPGSGVLDEADVIEAGTAQIPPGDDAVVVIVVVNDTTFPEANLGFIEYDLWPRPTAVIGLHRGPMLERGLGLIPFDVIEATTVAHEVGHWLGVPAREFHISSVDGFHCTNARCVMFAGASRAGSCAVLANLFTGVPTRFGPDCAAELAEMRRRRETEWARPLLPPEDESGPASVACSALKKKP